MKIRRKRRASEDGDGRDEGHFEVVELATKQRLHKRAGMCPAVGPEACFAYHQGHILWLAPPKPPPGGGSGPVKGRKAWLEDGWENIARSLDEPNYDRWEAVYRSCRFAKLSFRESRHETLVEYYRVEDELVLHPTVQCLIQNFTAA
eukprot:IDg16825t1